MSAEPARAYLGISEVIAQLRDEFPDISVSKIRFLESEGLIQPARSPSKYRKFDAADVERLRYILTAQRDEYLPLRVIKERLPPPAAEGAPGAGASAPGGASLTRRELLDAAGIDETQLADLETFGLVRRVGRVYGPSALQVAAAAAVLSRFGVEARHLRAVRAAAEREISFIEQVVAPTLRQRKPEAREQAGRTAREIATLTLRLHRALIEAALAEAGFLGYGLPEPGSADGPAAGAAARGAAGDAAAGRAATARSGPEDAAGPGYQAGRPGARRPDRGFGGASA
jgi:DNA-binding transcriptional MerR regulator